MDFFATKGIEYLLVIGYLLLLVPFAWFLKRVAATPVTSRQPGGAASAARLRYGLPEGLHLHRGHTWALPDRGDLLRVGMDAFAHQLIGQPAALLLPARGHNLEQGQRGWQLEAHGQKVDLLSPVQGEVVEVNEEALRNPALVCEDPYGRGWLMKVRVSNPATAMNNLLPRKLANVHIDEAREELGALMGDDLGRVLQDGGLPVPGVLPQLVGERWPEIAARLLLTE